MKVKVRGGGRQGGDKDRQHKTTPLSGGVKEEREEKGKEGREREEKRKFDPPPTLNLDPYP